MHMLLPPANSLSLLRASHFAELLLLPDAARFSGASGCVAAQLSLLAPVPVLLPAAAMPPATEERAPMIASMLATASAAKPPSVLRHQDIGQ